MNNNATTDAHEIRCPHCGTVFTIDEAEYADIARQVRTTEFDNELHARLAEADAVKQTEIALVEAKAAQASQRELAGKDAEVHRLSAELQSAATVKELAVTKAVSDSEKQLTEARSQLALHTAEQKAKDASLKNSHSKELALKDESSSG